MGNIFLMKLKKKLIVFQVVIVQKNLEILEQIQIILIIIILIKMAQELQ